MSNLNLNNAKVEKKWAPIMEKMQITDPSRISWMSEYAEFHQIHENVGYATQGNITGMGAVISPSVSSIPGQTGYGTGIPGSSYGNGSVVGSGDFGQQILPIAMKIAAQTIGLDLVAVKPTAGPVIDLMYIDYRYDDGEASANYNPILFKLNTTIAAVSSGIITQLRNIITSQGIRQTSGGLTGRIFLNLNANNPLSRLIGGVIDSSIEPTTKAGVIEFLGFSRIDGFPMFKAYRTTNAASYGSWRFDAAANTFAELENIVSAFSLGTATSSGLTISYGSNGGVAVTLVSALEDMAPGFSAPNGLSNPMSREDDDKTYPGIIAPQMTTKRVQVGTIEVSSALKRTEIEDIKAQTGIDIVQKLNGVLMNELSQTISKQIVNKIFEMGNLNRKSAPNYLAVSDNIAHTLFDFDVDAYLTGSAPGGETSQSLQRKLVTKVKNGSGYISTEGRVGPATYLVTNHTLASALTEGSNYSLNPVDASVNGNGQLYPMGKVAGITVYVDPYMKYDDKRIALGRKNNTDQPGIIFVPYLMAQSIQLISEATFAPRMLLRSRYAIAEIGFFPQKQYLTIFVTDVQNRLN